MEIINILFNGVEPCVVVKINGYETVLIEVKEMKYFYKVRTKHTDEMLQIVDSIKRSWIPIKI